ncbi:MAG TPA: SpoIIE family protein phosphatase, partial [Thermoanaerobaculia bacterium]|nr:SpoIIE family protein phosphatase [Thermoanaerobaculia bacterium]
MKIRTQLILAFLLLAILPLTGIVLYSYYSSLRAVRQATETEAGMLAKEMDGRMTTITAQLGRGVGRMGEFSDVVEAIRVPRQQENKERERILGEMLGDAAPLVRSVELIPRTPIAPPAPGPTAPAPPAPPSSAPSAEAVAPAIGVVVDVPQILADVHEALEEVPVPTPAPAPEPLGSEPEIPGRDAMPEEVRRRIDEQFARHAEERAKMVEKLAVLEEKRRASRRALERDVEVPVWKGDEVVGTVKAKIMMHEVLQGVLGTRRSGGEIPFAFDAQGRLHTASREDRAKIERLPIMRGVHAEARTARWVFDEWAVATQKDPETGLVLGIARPVPLGEVRQAAARNFGYGLGMIGLALLGILPLSKRMTREVRLVTAGADRIAQGDLETRLPVRSKNELGTLALAFNRMADDLKRHQGREIAQALLQTEYERKSQELEDARLFQLSLLPKVLPDHPGFEIAVSMRTATEVGGDYYDFLLTDAGTLTAAVGDATGHGARAGTMVTAVKSLFSAFASRTTPRELLAEAARAVKRMELERMAMGLCLVRLEGGTLTVSSAGMPPILLHRSRDGRAEEIALVGMPLGGLLSTYEERRLEIHPGDTVLLMSDGLPELT